MEAIGGERSAATGKGGGGAAYKPLTRTPVRLLSDPDGERTMNAKPQPTITVVLLTPDALARCIEDAAERGATRALARCDGEGLLSAERVALFLGYAQPSGRANMEAFKSFRRRHPEFTALGMKLGPRLYWPRAAVQRWLTEHPERPRATAVASQAGGLS